LGNIEAHREQLGRHIFSLAKNRRYTNGEVLFYDLSSANISGLRCVMAKWGHCKDGYRVHIVLLLVITPEGYPIYWELLEGNTADSKTIEGLISKVEKIYGSIESLICFDRGMVSDENLRLLEGKSIRFITALDGNQVQYFDESIDFELINKVKQLDVTGQSNEIEKYLAHAGMSFAKKNLFFKEIKLKAAQKRRIEELTDKLDLSKRRYFLAFNPELAYLTHKHRKERVQEFRKWIEEYNEELSQALGNRKKEAIEKAIKDKLRRQKIANVEINYSLSKYKVENVNVEGKNRKATTYKIYIEDITEESYKNAKKYDGIWILLTNISEKQDKDFFAKTSFSSFFEIYRLKNTIEESFRILSDFVEIEPFYVYRDEHVKAHFTICVLSYLLDTTILNRIRSCEKTDNMDLHSVFNILRKCKQDEIQLDERTVVSQLTQVTATQKKLLDTLGCTYLTSPQYLAANNIISIHENRA
jgi:transposase